ncbi:MAG: DUF4398 domain-containing protein [Gammaproteobacteria bacterium]|nr:DUF4398 domain-containing protein [Gammaproteobacteria bacterium]
MNKTNLIFCGIAAAALTLGGCSSAPKPRTEIALTSTALQNAELAGAREYAPIELRQASEKSAAAETAMKKEEYEKAKRLSEQALVDAEFARAKAEAEKSRLALKEAQDNIQLLRTEMQRTSAE